MYSTIPVKREVKRILEKDKGDQDWSEYLLSLYEEARRRRGRDAFTRLAQVLGEEDLDKIESEAREFRGRFTLR